MPADENVPLLMPHQFEALLTSAFEAHEAAMKSKTPADWSKAATLREQARQEYARVYDKLNEGMTEALRR